MKIKNIFACPLSGQILDIFMFVNIIIILLSSYILKLNFNTLLMSWMFILLISIGARVYKKSFRSFMQETFSSHYGSILVPLHMLYTYYFANTLLPSFFWFSQSPYVLYASSIYLGCFLFHCLTDMVEQNLYFFNSLILGATGFLFILLFSRNTISELSLPILITNSCSLVYSFLTMGLVLVFFQLIKLYGKLRGYTEVIGLGDIILLCMLSFWFSGYFLLLTMIIACITGAVYGLIYSYSCKVKNIMALKIGFAPFLFIGTMGASYLLTYYPYFRLTLP